MKPLSLLNETQSVDLESPVRAYPCNHICRYGTALTWSGSVLFHRYLQTGKFMRARYPGPVVGENLVSPVDSLTWESPFGTVCVATMVACVMR